MSIAQKEANKRDISSGKRVTQQQRILNLLNGALAMNREQIAKWTGFKESSVTGRCSELVSEGKLIETYLNGVTYYSYVHAYWFSLNLKKRKQQERTKRVLNALINDSEAMDILIKQVFLSSYELFIKGYSNDFIKEDIIEIIKKEIK